MEAPLIAVENLEKTFRLGLRRKKVEAVRGVSFSVQDGDIFGFLGPNGAGKTTTIKMLMGLIEPTQGSARLFGEPVSHPEARRKIGFLPENPYVHPFLTPMEFVTMSGQLSGLSGAALRSRVKEVLGKTGILYAADRPVKRLSKGMLQRTGLAAALVGDPRLLILDEPMSGLDPIGRKEVKDLIIEERKNGRTIFFSTHILGDVETLCDRVTIMRKGKIVVSGQLDELLRGDDQRIAVVLLSQDSQLREYCSKNSWGFEEAGGRLRVELPGKSALAELLAYSVDKKQPVESVSPLHETLEELFVRKAILAESEQAEENQQARDAFGHR
ncbi:MAG: ABC transporter ATP-binding protein [Polyangiaceae bacterium]|nr:ABC transporter ATP-binding protein [Polyangiaceae bacterium]